MGDVTVGFSRAVQINIAYAMVVASVDGAADVPSVQRVESDVEAYAEAGIPVAVDVLWSRDASTRLLVIGDDIADGVAGGLPRAIGVEAPVALGLGHLESVAVGDELRLAHHLEVGAQVGGERRLQAWITYRDVQRISVVVDVEQLSDVGLLRLSAEVHLQVGLLVEAYTQVERRRYVGDGTHRVDGASQILLDVVRLLGVEGYADVQVHLVADVAQLQVGIVAVLRAFGIAAEAGAEIRLVGVLQESEEGCPLAIFVQYVGKGFVRVFGEVVGRRVVLLVVVAIAVVQLQEESLLAETSSTTITATTTASATKWSTHFRHAWHAAGFCFPAGLEE